MQGRNDFREWESFVPVAEPMNDKKDFEFLEHTADAYVAAYGKNLAEAFENSARATFEVMTDLKEVSPRIQDYSECI
jgi:hypothetical protein